MVTQLNINERILCAVKAQATGGQLSLPSSQVSWSFYTNRNQKYLMYSSKVTDVHQEIGCRVRVSVAAHSHQQES